MLISRIRGGCKVGFYGLGVSSIALLGHLPLEKCDITLRSDQAIDRSVIPNNLKIKRIFEKCASLCDIDEEILIFSPSVRRDRAEFEEAKKRGVIFTSDAELFFEENKKPLFAITGSDGKSTTATLTHLLLSASGLKSNLIGNIGKPFIEADKKCDVYVAELSSFMLQYSTPKAKRGCVSNITPNHLDWHTDLTEYKKTKISLLNSSDEFVVSDENLDIEGAYGVISLEKNYRSLSDEYKAEIYITNENGYISKNGKYLLNVEDIQRREKHNLKNLMMAIAMTDGYAGIDEIRSVAKSFKGLPHRCEKVMTVGNVEFINSSIDSTPARTVATLTSLDREVVIILGGGSKGLDYTELVPTLMKYARQAIITGDNAGEIYRAIGKATKSEIIPDFEAAIRRGATLAQSVGVLLLSPASTSYDRFKNYAERGEKFKAVLAKIYAI